MEVARFRSFQASSAFAWRTRLEASGGGEADKTRLRSVSNGGGGGNMKFLSKQPFSIRMTYIGRSHSVGVGGGRVWRAHHEKKRKDGEKERRNKLQSSSCELLLSARLEHSQRGF